MIDLQKGIVGMPTVHPASEIIGRSAQLARAFRKRGLPVVLVNVTRMTSRRTDAGPPKFSPLADGGTTLDDYLRQRGVTQIVLTGIATSAGVESTARSAVDLGYNVVLVVDTMTDRDADVIVTASRRFSLAWVRRTQPPTCRKRSRSELSGCNSDAADFDLTCMASIATPQL